MATKERKQEVVSELQGFFDKGNVVIVADLTGLTVAELTTFRRNLSKDNAKLKIAKNTLVKRAIVDSQFQALESLAKGPSAFVVGYDDPAQPAKSVVDYLKKVKKGSVRGAVLEGKALTPKDVSGLANLPSKEQLLSSIMGGLDSGARNIAGILSAVIRDIALLTEEVAKKTNAGAPAVAAKATPEAKEESASEASPEAAKEETSEAPKAKEETSEAPEAKEESAAEAPPEAAAE
jgi:large subunit ribosomal protein L10